MKANTSIIIYTTEYIGVAMSDVVVVANLVIYSFANER
jgi:hypothetical protein